MLQGKDLVTIVCKPQQSVGPLRVAIGVSGKEKLPFNRKEAIGHLHLV